MDITKYKDIVNICGQIGMRTGDGEITDTAEWIRLSLEEEHKPAMALVSFNLNHQGCFSFINQYIEAEIPKEIAELTEGKPICLILDYHETPVIMSGNNAAGNKMIVGLPAELLKKNRIVICDEIRSGKEWVNLSNEIDIVCLNVNATMAMTRMERVWLKDCAKLLFADDEIVVVINGMEMLNGEEEADSVRKIVDEGLNRSGIHAKVFGAMKEAVQWMGTFLEDNPVKEIHDKRVVRNGLQALRERMTQLAESALIDGDNIQSAVKQLEKQKKTLEMAGQLAAESILCNSFNGLKMQACESARCYGRQMAENIRKKVESASLEQLETMEDKINGYISGAWKYYLNSMFLKMEKETEKIMGELAKQMERDAGALISSLDEAAQRAIYAAIGLREMENAELLEYETDSRPKASPASINVSAVSDKLRKETRNMLLLSIPLFFIHPLLSAGNVLIVKYFGKVRMDSELKDIQEEVARRVENICFENTEAIVRQIEESFDDAARAGKLDIKKAYGGLTGQLEKRLGELAKKQEDGTELRKYLKEQTDILQVEWSRIKVVL